MVKQNLDIEAIKARPNLAGQLPYRFAGGGHEMDSILIDCDGCGAEVPSESIHGEIVPVNAVAASLEAHGICPGCGTITPASARFSSNGEILFREGAGDWQRGRFEHPPSLAKRVIEGLVRWCKRIQKLRSSRFRST